LARDPPRDDNHVVVDARGDERPGDHERVQGAGAKGLHVASGRVPAAGLLGDRLPEVASSALIAVADGLLPAADRVLDVLGGEAGRLQHVLEGEGTRRLAGEVLEKDGGREAFVEVVRAKHDAGAIAVRVDGERAVGDLAAVELEELELVGRRHAAVELPLVDEDPEGAFALCRARMRPPRPLDLPELLRAEVPDEHLVGRVGERILEAAQLGRDLVGGTLTGWLRPVADEIRRVGEDKRAGVDGGAHEFRRCCTCPLILCGSHARVMRR
jgi:hypothetical protein